ncbi:hypothetical protein Misp04_48070 [Micromonospora sp. NBRC 101691]|nr:hypothetical protein Misp04_48070 [Micromonospora sp. NBRC 101691]
MSEGTGVVAGPANIVFSIELVGNVGEQGVAWVATSTRSGPDRHAEELRDADVDACRAVRRAPCEEHFLRSSRPEA